MAENTKAANNAAASDVDIGIIAQIFKSQKNKRLEYRPEQPNPDGTKNIIWVNQDIEWPKHVSGELLQGGNPAFDGKAVYAFVDVDRAKAGKNKGSIFTDLKIEKEIKDTGITEKEKVCMDLWKVDTKLNVFMSPSGAYHAFKFYHKETPLREVNKDIKNIERILKKKFRYNVDSPKTLPTLNGSQSGCNLPWSRGRVALAPTGKELTFKQFTHRYRFQDHPLLAAAAGLEDPGRHDALIIIAAYLHKKKMMQYLNDVVANFGTDWTDQKYLDRIIHKRIHEKYDVGFKAINQTVSNAVEFEWELPAADATLATIEDPTDELEVFEHTGSEKIKPRPWLIEGWALKKALTLLVGQPGIGKTMLLHMLGYALATGNPILLKTILERGNVLIIAAEETLNEMDLRLKAASEMMGKNDGKFKIYKRGLENELKLVKFTKDGAEHTTQYKQLLNTIKNKEIKYIILDPLINFQTGTYDENSNQNMDNYIKNYLIPIAVKMDGAVFAGHHTNKISMVSTHDQELLVDNQNALTAARGASALIGAARFVLALQPMTRKLWEDHFKVHVTDGSNFVHYTGLIEAKSNYNIIADDILWLKKNDVHVQTEDGYSEKTGCYSTTDLNKISKAKNKLKAAQNLQWCKAQMPLIQQLMKKVNNDTITLNSIVLELLPLDPDHADEKIPEATIKTRIRRKLENGFSGREETKDGYERAGIEWSDGYNYWLKRDHSKSGAASVFLTRAVDFKRKNKSR